MQLVSSTCQKCCVISLGFMHKIPMSSSTQQKRKVIWKKFESSLETRPSNSRQFLNNTSLSKPLSFLPTHPLIIEGSHFCHTFAGLVLNCRSYARTLRLQQVLSWPVFVRKNLRQTFKTFNLLPSVEKKKNLVQDHLIRYTFIGPNYTYYVELSHLLTLVNRTILLLCVQHAFEPLLLNTNQVLTNYW